MNLRRARTLATVGTVACILSVSMLIAQTADGAVAEAVDKARRFIETPGRAQMILAAVHPFATYDDVRYVGPNSLQNGYFEVVYNFHWDDYGQTEIGFQCDSGGNVRAVHVLADRSPFPAFAASDLFIQLVGGYLIESNKDNLNTVERNLAKSALDHADSKTLLEVILWAEQKSGTTDHSEVPPVPDKPVDSHFSEVPKAALSSSTPTQQSPQSTPSTSTGPTSTCETTGSLVFGSRAKQLEVVHYDINAYIAAAANGFEYYKQGQPSVTNGSRVWVSKVKPAIADACSVVEKKTASFRCTITFYRYQEATLNAYVQLVEDIGKSLPRNWEAQAAPPYKTVGVSKRFISSDGMEGDVWVDFDPDQNKYSLQFELISSVQNR